MLYMAALSAARYNVTLKTFSDRLKARGKPSKVRLIAVARKLLTIANAAVRDGRDATCGEPAPDGELADRVAR
jgi:transposase